MKIIEFIKHNDVLLRRIIITLLLFMVTTALFVSIASQVVGGSALPYDESILLSINQQSNPGLDTFFKVATEFGGVIAVTILTTALFVYLVSKKLKYKALLVAFGVGGAALINVVAKYSFARDRPDLWGQLISETSFSFPSGHAMGSSALAFTVIALLWNTKWRVLSIALGTLYFITIGFSRLYLGVHYPTDVLAGWTLSLLWVSTVATIIYTRRKYKTSKEDNALNAELGT